MKGREYEVVLVARDVETEEPVVAYQTGSGVLGAVARDFTAHAVRDGYDVPRFVLEP